jgi:hypothetical protein
MFSMQPYLNTTRQSMEDDLNLFLVAEGTLQTPLSVVLFVCPKGSTKPLLRPGWRQVVVQWTSNSCTCLHSELCNFHNSCLKIAQVENGRQPYFSAQMEANGSQPQFCSNRGL